MTTSIGMFSIVAPTDVNNARMFREQLCQWIEIAIAILAPWAVMPTLKLRPASIRISTRSH
ncbi:MAG: hypothetical protein KIS86_02575 [Devosia sp.]|nr:hypothetical protein [Devosia sp.]